MTKPVSNHYLEIFVDKFYSMNPKTDDLLPNGLHLSNGMKVLIENNGHRHKISEDQLRQDWQVDRALEWNRWCTVSNFELVDQLIKFVGTYEDGTKRVRRTHQNDAWLVRLDSISDSLLQATEQYSRVIQAVMKGMSEAANIPFNEMSDAKKSSLLLKQAHETTKQILGLL